MKRLVLLSSSIVENQSSKVFLSCGFINLFLSLSTYMYPGGGGKHFLVSSCQRVGGNALSCFKLHS